MAFATPLVFVMTIYNSYSRYKTYVIFAVINAFIVPTVYFFYPETAYRSLEEMDAIFRKTSATYGNGFLSWIKVVKVAREEPRRYGKKGELLIKYEETEEFRERRESVLSGAYQRRASEKKGALGDEKGMDVKN